MAELVKTTVGFADVAKPVTFTALTGTDYINLEAGEDYPDQRLTLLVKNGDATHDATLTFKAGDGVLGALGDLAVTVAGGAQAAIPVARLDTARVKNLSGASKGQIVVASAIAAGGTLGSVSVGVVAVA